MKPHLITTTPQPSTEVKSILDSALGEFGRVDILIVYQASDRARDLAGKTFLAGGGRLIRQFISRHARSQLGLVGDGLCRNDAVAFRDVVDRRTILIERRSSN